MSTDPLTSSQFSQQVNRRSSSRMKFDQLTYVDLALGNGGILIDLGEGGLGFQSVAAMKNGQHVQVKFTLPGVTAHIAAIGKVAWLNDSGKGGGLHLTACSEQGRKQIRTWISRRVSTNVTFQQQREMKSVVPPKAPDSARMIVAVRKSVAEVAVVGSVGTEKTKPQIVSPVPRHVAHSEIRHTRPELTTVESKVVTEKAHARRGQSIFVLGTLFGGLLVLTAVMGTHLSSNTSTAPATNSSSALSRISNSGPSDQFAVPASYIAELEGVQSDGSRPTSTLLAQDPPHQPDVRRTSRAALLIERVEPKYPLVAKEEHLGGAVTVEATIAKDGVPHVLRFVGGELRLAEAAMAAISLWRYKPALLGGQPVESQINITVNFEYKP